MSGDAIKRALGVAAWEKVPPMTGCALLCASLCLRGSTDGWDDLPWAKKGQHKREDHKPENRAKEGGKVY